MVSIVNGKKVALIAGMVLVLGALPCSALAKIFFSPDYVATLTGDVSGGGLVMTTGYFMEIGSDTAKNDFLLTFSGVFRDYEGDHYGYLYMKRTSRRDLTVEVFYTYGPEPVGSRTYYQLHGFGVLEGDKKAGWFRIECSGSFTLSEDEGSTGDWVEVWRSQPGFTVDGRKI